MAGADRSILVVERGKALLRFSSLKRIEHDSLDLYDRVQQRTFKRTPSMFGCLLGL